ncbi:hypothetical protein M0804_013735 [Polistes exclamans]|nr:hypothetical protein M0804_013735 [Polistes exclamans]
MQLTTGLKARFCLCVFLSPSIFWATELDLKFSGVGGGTNTTIGEYNARLTIDINLYVVLMRVVPNAVLSQKLILGIDFLSTVDVAIKDGNAINTPKAEHRGAEIQENKARELWRHVLSKHNPADLISRGVTPAELRESRL